MKYIPRLIEKDLIEALKRGKSVLLLGPRQTGKTTLLKHIGQAAPLNYTLLDPDIRLRLEKSPGLLRQEIKAYCETHPSKSPPLVIIDEVQKVPPLMDVIQLAIDNREAQFVLTGSSVRKLRRHAQFNLLPGRVVNFHLDPFSLLEISQSLPEIETLLWYGSLPGIYLGNDARTKQIDLEAYVSNYLEEEIRQEALVRQIGSFAKFLELSALESGNQINLSKLSQELGVSRHTIAEYFQILEDCLVAEKIMPITDSTSRQRLTKSPKYLLFDLGIRRILATEGTQLDQQMMGRLFEQFVGLELLRALRATIPMAKLRYWRDHAGPEVDYVIEIEKKYIPIEVKWSAQPLLRDAKHLITFMKSHESAKQAYIISRTPRSFVLSENIIVLPWQEMHRVMGGLDWKALRDEGRR